MLQMIHAESMCIRSPKYLSTIMTVDTAPHSSIHLT